MSQLPPLDRVADIRMGRDAAQQAWIQHFLIENNMDPSMSPALVAGPDQLRFMVALEADQVYFPCSDELFLQFYQGKLSPALQREYAASWRFIETLLDDSGLPEAEKQRLLHLCRYRFELYVGSRMILPSRLVKRLVSLVLGELSDPDPFRAKKTRANAAMLRILDDERYARHLKAAPPPAPARTIAGQRWQLDYVELERLFRISCLRGLWNGEVPPDGLAAELAEPCPHAECLHELLGPENRPRKKILYLPDLAGGFIADLRLARSLVRQGHQVVLALKDSFYFQTPVLWDLETDPVLKASMEGIFVLDERAVSKNRLLQAIREHRLVVISDGTAEQANLYRVSVTFARAWKESDLVIAKGRRNSSVFLGTSHQFTRDVLCFWRDDENTFHMRCKPKCPDVRKFTEHDIVILADDIIAQMRQARENGKTVMFYSAIIGSIPGQTTTAVTVATAFVEHLRQRVDDSFIINPAEHFERGLDGDDLMFMWERVQRSGYLDVWRFQTVDDIEVSFELMGRKVPSVWIGKDATFSTGCTKEMLIALDVQRKHPELQIIGPDPERFFRRGEYGVGQYFDERIKR